MGRRVDKLWDAIEILSDDPDEDDNEIFLKTGLELSEVQELREFLEEFAENARISTTPKVTETTFNFPNLTITSNPEELTSSLDYLLERVNNLEARLSALEDSPIQPDDEDYDGPHEPSCPLCRYTKGYMGRGIYPGNDVDELT